MKLHISLNVEDIGKSIAFYSSLFGKPADIVRDNYAKWDVDDPSVNFVIESNCCASNSGHIGFDHIGIEADDRDQLATLVERIRQSGNPWLEPESTTCCYARSDKAWVRGAAGEPWEAFLTHDHDNEEYGHDRTHLLPLK